MMGVSQDASQVSLPASTVPASSPAVRKVCEHPSRVEEEEFLNGFEKDSMAPVLCQSAPHSVQDMDEQQSGVSVAGTTVRPPDEEFLDQFQQYLLSSTRRRVRRRVEDSVSDAPEVGRTDGGSRRPSRRVVLVPGSEEGTPQSIQDRVPSTVPASGMEIPTTVPASSGAVRRLVLVYSQPVEPTGEGRPEIRPVLESARVELGEASRGWGRRRSRCAAFASMAESEEVLFAEEPEHSHEPKVGWHHRELSRVCTRSSTRRIIGRDSRSVGEGIL